MEQNSIPLFLLEDVLAMVIQEFSGWRCQFVGHTDWFPLEPEKIHFERVLRKELPQLRAEDHYESLVESHQS